MATVPESLKSISSVIKLANDTESRDPVIAYWLRYYIMQKALNIDSKSPPARAFLTELISKLEKDKSSLKNHETVVDDTAAQAHVENYGSRLFEVADTEDRSGNASLKTVKIYLAASQLFESLSIFGDISEEISERTKYAKFRAATIMKAVKLGEKPPPPENIDPLDSLPIPPSFSDPFSGQQTPPSNVERDDKPPINSMPVAPRGDYRDTAAAAAPSGAQVSTASVDRAMKLCKFASSALMLHDIPAAVENLEEALSLLRGTKAE